VQTLNEQLIFDDNGNLVFADYDDSVLTDEIQVEKSDHIFIMFERKMRHSSIHDTGQHHSFLEKVEQIVRRYPFVDIKEFVEDYLRGISEFRIRRKYGLLSSLDFYRIASIYLGFRGKRVKYLDDSFSQNLRVEIWNEKYDILTKSFDFFTDELNQLACYNVFRGLFFAFLLKQYKSDYSSIYKDFKNFAINHKNDIDLLKYSKEFGGKFSEYLEKQFDEKLDQVISEFNQSNILKIINESTIQLDAIYMNVEESLLELLDSFENGITHKNFQFSIIKKFPMFNIIPINLIWILFMDKMQKEGKIIRKHNHAWMGRPYTDDIFTATSFDKFQKRIREELYKYGQTKFFGRKISPDTFIDELNNLPKGTFGDKDDQVTRIAGLVLSNSVLMQGPHEKDTFFDFSVDLTGYVFKPEQIDAMRRQNFRLNSKIIHCKIMINERITRPILEKMRERIPNGEQAVIFSFVKMSNDAKNYLSRDERIQIVDEDGIKNWVSISKYIPCRIGSVAKIRFDPSGQNLGRVARIDSINYETGLASITILPEMATEMIHVRSLEEIPLNIENQTNYERSFNNYFQFLRLVFKYSHDEFQLGLNITPSDQVMKSYNELVFTFDNITTSIIIARHSYLGCSCFRHAENRTMLCRHLVYAINHVAINKSYLDMELSADNPIMGCVIDFINDNSKNMIHGFYFDLNHEDRIIFKEFLKYHAMLK
jgi:hypothetical protein